MMHINTACHDWNLVIFVLEFIGSAPKSRIHLHGAICARTFALNYYFQNDRPLWQTVSTVDSDISTCAVAGCI